MCTLLVSANLKTICLYNDANAGQAVLYADDNTGHVTSKYPEALVRKIQQQADKSTDWVKIYRIYIEDIKLSLRRITSFRLQVLENRVLRMKLNQSDNSNTSCKDLV